MLFRLLNESCYLLAASTNQCRNLKDQSMKLTKLHRFVLVFS